MTFPHKTALSEANVKTKRIGSTKWIYHKERSFASNYSIFSKILFQFENLIYRVDFPYAKMSIFILFESVRVLLEGAFSL